MKIARLGLSILPLLFLLAVAAASAAEPLHLRCGPVSLEFDPENASLRDVRVGEHRILSGINAPVRNQFWGTVRPVVDNIVHRSDGDRFELSFDVTCRERDIDFVWQGKITGDHDGRVVFTFAGQARSTFLRNRIGFCLLHGPEVAGQRCVVETVAGAKVEGRFPSYISPHQPFKKIQAITHEVRPGLWARVLFEGDTFEMEDQRNWTDASFKTYCTPLEVPYPVKVFKGTEVQQRVELTLMGDLPEQDAAGRSQDPPVTLTLSHDQKEPPVAPGIGLQLSGKVDEFSDTELARLKALNLDHLRLDLAPADRDLPANLRRATAQAKSLDVKLHIALHLGEHVQQELMSLVEVLQSTRPPVSVWMVVSGNSETIGLARRHLSAYARQALIGTNENTNFTELNRNRPDPAEMDVVVYGLNPQVHAFDNRSMIETLAIQGDTVRSARQFIGDLPLIISPITLKPQQVNQEPLPGELPSNVDQRQSTLFAAAWTLASFKYLADAGVQGLTYYRPLGWQGVMESESGSPLPQRFPSTAGTVFPVYHVLADIGEFAGGTVHEALSTKPLAIQGLALKRPGSRRLLVVNLTGKPQTVQIKGIRGDFQLRRLDNGNLQTAISRPRVFRSRSGEAVTAENQMLSLRLPSHGIARLDQSSN